MQGAVIFTHTWLGDRCPILVPWNRRSTNLEALGTRSIHCRMGMKKERKWTEQNNVKFVSMFLIEAESNMEIS